MPELEEKYGELITKQVTCGNYAQLLFGSEEDHSSLLTRYDEINGVLSSNIALFIHTNMLITPLYFQ